MAKTIRNPQHRFTSPFGMDLPMPDTKRFPSWSSLLFSRVQQYGQRKMFIDSETGDFIRYSEFEPIARKFGAGLVAHGFEQGDVLALLSLNRIEYFVAVHGVNSVGGVVTPCNPNYTERELEHQIRDSGAKWILTADDTKCLTKATSIAQKLGWDPRERVVVFEQKPGWLSFDALSKQDCNPFPDVEIDPNSCCLIAYSSGTTGKSKGVQHSHRAIMSHMYQCAYPAVNHFGPNDVVMGFVPMYHASGMMVLSGRATHCGSTVVLMKSFDMERFLQTIEKYRVTVVPSVPPIVLRLSKDPLVDKFDLSSVREIACGAAPLGHELAKLTKERVGAQIFRQNYGMTETVVLATHGTADSTKYGSVGKLLPNIEMLIVDPEIEKTVGVGKRGELWLRGPNIMMGYLNRPDATANTIDSDGWLHTGDIGVIDEDGCVYIVDRIKELIKFRGLQVAPAELEALLQSHEEIQDAAVIGILEEGLGESPKGFIVRNPGSTITGPQVQEFVASQVSPHKKLRMVEFVDRIPKSQSGKILRRLIRDQELEKHHMHSKL